MSSAPTSDFTKCPICSEQTLKKHCKSKTCHWQQCRNDACQATLDGGRRIGYCKDPLGRPRPEGAPAPPADSTDLPQGEGLA